MLMRGIKPPELGSTKDRLMSRMFMMEQVESFNGISTMLFGLATVTKGDKQVFNNVRNLLEEHQKSLAFGNWSVSRMKEKIQHQQDDQDVLARVNALSRMEAITLAN